MFGLLFGVIAVGAIIMACLFFYWLKYVYVEKDERRQYSPLSQNINETNNNNKNFYKVSPDFIKKINERKSKKIQIIVYDKYLNIKK